MSYVIGKVRQSRVVFFVSGGLFLLASCGESSNKPRPIASINESTNPAPSANSDSATAIRPTATPVISASTTASPSVDPDAGLPKATALGVSFVDSDPEGGIVEGNIQIQKASDESSFSAYAVYWGSSSSAKLGGTAVISVLPKTGENLSVALTAGTAVPTNATHILVFTKNDVGEMKTGVSTDLNDVGLPTSSALSIGFTDTSPKSGKLSGEINITRAFDETEIDDYLIYWGSSATTKLANSAALAVLVKTGNNLSISLQAETPIPAGATHLLVRTKNKSGEMASGVSLEINDLGVPSEAAAGLVFADTNGAVGKLDGNITITPASNTASFTHYVVYWGSDAATRLAGSQPVATIAKADTLTFALPANTSLPPQATHFLVRTKNEGGEMTTGPSVAIDDLGLPRNPAVSLSFSDADPRGGWIKGSINIVRALDESDLTDYVVYWGLNATTKLALAPLGVVGTSDNTRIVGIPNSCRSGIAIRIEAKKVRMTDRLLPLLLR